MNDLRKCYNLQSAMVQNQKESCLCAEPIRNRQASEESGQGGCQQCYSILHRDAQFWEYAQECSGPDFYSAAGVAEDQHM